MTAGVVLGASTVSYLDWDLALRQIAESYGVDTTIHTATELPESLPDRFDITVDDSGNPAALQLALRQTAANGICTFTSASIYTADIPLPLLHMYRQSITFHTGWVHTRTHMHAPLQLLADRRLDPFAAVTATVSFTDASAALAEPFTKLILRRDGA